MRALGCEPLREGAVRKRGHEAHAPAGEQSRGQERGRHDRGRIVSPIERRMPSTCVRPCPPSRMHEPRANQAGDEDVERGQAEKAHAGVLGWHRDRGNVPRSGGLTYAGPPANLLKSMSQKLLLADDSVTIQRVIELTFADEDVQVIAVGNGQQAIERVRSGSPRHRSGRRGHARTGRLRSGCVHQGEPRARAHSGPAADGRVRTDRRGARACRRLRRRARKAVRAADGDQPRQGSARRAPAGRALGHGPGWRKDRSGHASGEVDRRAPAAAAPAGATRSKHISIGSMRRSSVGADGAHDWPHPAPSAAPAPPPVSVQHAEPAPAPRREPIPLSRAAAPQEPLRAPGDALGDWDPDLDGDPSRPAAIEPPFTLALEPAARAPARSRRALGTGTAGIARPQPLRRASTRA